MILFHGTTDLVGDTFDAGTWCTTDILDAIDYAQRRGGDRVYIFACETGFRRQRKYYRLATARVPDACLIINNHTFNQPSIIMDKPKEGQMVTYLPCNITVKVLHVPEYHDEKDRNGIIVVQMNSGHTLPVPVSKVADLLSYDPPGKPRKNRPGAMGNT